MNLLMGAFVFGCLMSWGMANPLSVESASPLNPSGMGEIRYEADYYWVKYVTERTTAPEYFQTYLPARLEVRYTALPELEFWIKGSWVVDRRLKVSGFSEVAVSGLGSTIIGGKSVFWNDPNGPKLSMAVSVEAPTGNAKAVLPVSEGTNIEVHFLSTWGLFSSAARLHANVGYKQVGAYVDSANKTIQRGSLGLWGIGVEWPLPELTTGLAATWDMYGVWVMANTTSNGTSMDLSRNTYTLALAPGLQWGSSEVKVKIGTAWNVLYHLPGAYAYDLDWRWRHSLSVSYLFGGKY